VGVSPLLLACEKRNIEIVRMLVLSTPNINLNVIDKNGKTPLMVAVEKSSLDIVEFLLSEENNNINKVKINQRDFIGRTALFLAIRHMNRDIISHIMAKGGDLSICDNQGKNSLDQAEDLGINL
jgi:ankyrin repeat protein